MKKCRTRKGFTLVELTVVILIIGIIATIAAPKFFDSLSDASDKSAAQSIQVVRDAIELFRANSSTYPAQDGLQATLESDLDTYLRAGFPKCQVGKKNADVAFSEVDPFAVTAGAEAWIYNKTTGEFRINHADYFSY